jgi:hypothetical protein
MCTGSCLISGVAHARLPYEDTLFQGPAPHARGGVSQYVLGPCLCAGCAHVAWAVGGSQSDSLGAERRCLAQQVVEGRLSSCLRRGAAGGCVGAWDRDGPGSAVSAHGAESGMRGRLGWCGIRWLFPVCCSGGRLGPWAPVA